MLEDRREVVRRNFKVDLLATITVSISLALFAVGIANGYQILLPIAVALATVAVVAKFSLSVDRRKGNAPNSPRRRTTDREREQGALA
jgi:hypothetical protein